MFYYLLYKSSEGTGVLVHRLRAMKVWNEDGVRAPYSAKLGMK
jgi:hypothetical protein